MDRPNDHDTNRPSLKGLNNLGDSSRVNQHGVTDTTGDVVGEVTGGVAGAATGAALGSLGGPIGTLIGALAGALGGWWSGRAISEAASSFTNEDDSYYQNYHTTAAGTVADRGTSHAYDDVRPAYQLGHLAGRNPEYANRNFDEIEGDLQRGWTSDVSARHGDWSSVRPYARDAFERGRTGSMGSSSTSSSMGSSAMGAASMGSSSLGSSSMGSGRTVRATRSRTPGTRPRRAPSASATRSRTRPTT